MRVIWKVKLSLSGFADVTLPKGAKFLSLHTQRDEPVAWFECESDVGEEESRAFITIVTGEHFSEECLGDFLGTFLSSSGNYVGHVYEWIA